MELPRRSNEAFLRTLVRELLAQRGAAVCAIASALLDNFIVVRQSLPVKTPITRREVTNSSAVDGLWRSRQVGIKRDSVRVSDLEMRIAAALIPQVTQNGDALFKPILQYENVEIQHHSHTELFARLHPHLLLGHHLETRWL
jgi:hypothetical protein